MAEQQRELVKEPSDEGHQGGEDQEATKRQDGLINYTIVNVSEITLVWTFG